MNWAIMKDSKGSVTKNSGFVGLRKGVSTCLASYSTSVTLGIYILVVSVCYFIVSNYVFNCPCYYEDAVMTTRASKDNDLTELHQRSSPEGRVFYAISFLTWPAVVGWTFALVINGHTKRCLMDTRPNCDCKRHWHDVIYLLHHTGMTIVVPLIWVVISLLDGRFYECLMSSVPGPCLPVEVSKGQVLLALEKENLQLRTFSQALGFTVLGAAFVSVVLVMLCCQFVGRRTYYQDHYLSLYRKKEQETFNEVAEELIDLEVTKNWRNFLRKPRNKSDWQEVSLLSVKNPSEIDEKVVGSSLANWSIKTPRSPTSHSPRPCPPGAISNKDKDVLSATWVEVDEPGEKKKDYDNRSVDVIKGKEGKDGISREYATISSKDILATILSDVKPKHSVRFNDKEDKKQDTNNNNGKQSNYDPVSPPYSVPHSQKVNSKSVAVQAEPDTPMLKRREIKVNCDKVKVNNQGHANNDEGHSDYDNHIFKPSGLPRFSTVSETSTTSGLSAVSTFDYESPDSEDSDLSLTSVTTTSSSIQFISSPKDDLRPIVPRPSLPQKPPNVINAQGVNSTVVKKGYVQTLIERQNSQNKGKEAGNPPERSQSMKN